MYPSQVHSLTQQQATVSWFERGIEVAFLGVCSGESVSAEFVLWVAFVLFCFVLNL